MTNIVNEKQLEYVFHQMWRLRELMGHFSHAQIVGLLQEEAQIVKDILKEKEEEWPKQFSDQIRRNLRRSDAFLQASTKSKRRWWRTFRVIAYQSFDFALGEAQRYVSTSGLRLGKNKLAPWLKLKEMTLAQFKLFIIKCLQIEAEEEKKRMLEEDVPGGEHIGMN